MTSNACRHLSKSPAKLKSFPREPPSKLQTNTRFADTLVERMTEGTLAFWLTDLLNYQSLLSSPLAWVLAAFQLWMLIDAVRRGGWGWVVLLFLFPLINAVLY